jgi:hypothetical protein
LCARAQVAIEVTQDQDQFLHGEALRVAVRIINRSGQTLHLGADEDWLTFAIESREGGVVSETGRVPVVGEFELESSRVGIKRVDLQPYFSLPRPGRYAITATVKIKGWGVTVTSPPKSFDLIEGIRLWEQTFGLPKPTDATNNTPEVRKYILQQANYLKSQLRLYLRVTDASGSKTYKVCQVGAMLSFSRPDMRVDRLSNLHLLYQSGPRAFTYSVFNPDGDILIRQTHDFIQSRPRLQANDEGYITVTGGARRQTASDLPPPPEPEPAAPDQESDKASPSTPTPPPAAPSATNKSKGP